MIQEPGRTEFASHSKPQARLGSFHSASFETMTLGRWAAERMKQSPYIAIAASVNVALLAVATIWKLEDARRAERTLTSTVGIASAAQAEEKPDVSKEQLKAIFDETDAEVADAQTDIIPDDLPTFEFLEPDKFKLADHDETADNDPSGTVKGNLTSHNLVGEGETLFNSIGVGGGSARGGRGGAGNGSGGMFNTRKPHGRAAAPKSMIQAADAGLRWLARHQAEDGSWAPGGFIACCKGGAVCDGAGYPEHEVGTTGLALLAFLGSGYDTHSNNSWIDPFTKRSIRAGDVVKRGLAWLRSQQDEAGSYVSSSNAKWGYNQAVGTLAMAEGYGLSRSLVYKDSAQRAVDNLVAGQNLAPGGTGFLGWRYRPKSGDNDISVTGWAVMALKSAELAKLKVPQSSFEGAYSFCDEITDKTNGRVGYMRREDAGQQVKATGKNDDFANHPSLDAVGMCVRIFSRHDITDPMLELAAKNLSVDPPQALRGKKTFDAYYWYYASIGLNQYDGPDSPRPGKGAYWGAWKQALQKAVVETQVKDPRLCCDGSWNDEDRWGFEGGRVYLTAINTLTLEVYYRYQNAFGRR